MNDSIKTIRRSALSFFSGTLLSRVSGLLRDMAMAYAFGTEASVATFMAAFRFSHLARRLFGEGSLSNTFIPQFEELRHHHPERALPFFRDLAASLCLILSGFITITIAAFFFASNWASPQAAYLFQLISWMLPSLVFICLYGLNAALLECEKQYFIPSLAPIAFNAVWIGAALFLISFPPDRAMIGLSIGVILACFAQWAFTLPTLFKIAPPSLFRSIRPFSKDVRNLIKPLFLANLGVGASQINNALDPLFALIANGEGPAHLWFSLRIQQLPLALFGIALSGALLPPISRAIKRGDLEQFKVFFNEAKEKIAFITILITAGIIATAPACTNLLFGRGHFTLESVEGTALCLLAYGIGLFPMTYVLIAAPSLYAFNDYKTATRSAFSSMLLNIGLNSIFVFLLGWGAASIALATSLAAFWNGHKLDRAIGQKEAGFNRHLQKCILAGLISMGAVWAMDASYLGEIPTLQLLMGIPLNLSQSLSEQIFLFSMEATAFLIAGGMSSYLLFLFLIQEPKP